MNETENEFVVTVSNKMAAALKANPDNIRLTVRDANGLTLVEPCQVKTLEREKVDVLIDIWNKAGSAAKIADYVMLELVRAKEFRVFKIAGDVLTFLRPASVEQLRAERPTAVEVGFAELEAGLKNEPAGNSPYDQIGDNFDPLGVWTAELEMTVLTHNQVGDLYSWDYKLVKRIISLLRRGEVKCFVKGGEEPINYYVVAAEVEAFQSREPNVNDVSEGRIKSLEEFLGERWKQSAGEIIRRRLE
jgi:hypothetical protein